MAPTKRIICGSASPRVRAFDIITLDEPTDTQAKIVELYNQRWNTFPDVAKVLLEEQACSPEQSSS